MVSNAQTPVANYIVAGILGLVAVVMLFNVLTGRQFPLVTDERGALVALVVIGVVMCTLGGIGPTQSTYGWTHPIMFAGIILGVLALLVTGLTLIGANTAIPLIGTDRSALIALATIMVIKVALVALQRLIAPELI